jgi:hypothetical protein
MIDLHPKGVRGGGPPAIAFDARKLGKGSLALRER